MKAFVLLIVLLVGWGIFSCSTKESANRENTVVAEENATEPEPDHAGKSALEEAQSYFRETAAGTVGEGVTLEGRRVTVLEAGRAQSKNPDMFEVTEGTRLLYIQTQVENLNAEPWKSSVAQFFLRDATGEEYSPALYPIDKGDMLPQVEMEQGDVSTGYIGYEIPEGVSDLVLAYAVRLDQGKVILVDLGGVE